MSGVYLTNRVDISPTSVSISLGCVEEHAPRSQSREALVEPQLFD
jgi:hypothetical protein